MQSTIVGSVIIFAITIILILALISIIILIITYSSTEKKLKDTDYRQSGTFENNFLDNVVSDFQKANKSKLSVNTYAIVESNVYKHFKFILLTERFQKTATSLMIILGLMGTFFGLTLSVSKLVELLSDLKSIEEIIPTMAQSVEGMAIAFNTSLYGIGGSIILTVVRMIFSAEEKKESLIVSVEDYLDNVIAKQFAEEKFNEYDKLIHSMEQVFRQFGSNIMVTMDEVVRSSAENMDNSVQAIDVLSAGLQQSVASFQRSIDKFGENNRDLSEFNYHLRENVQRMGVVFSDLSEVMKKESINRQSSKDYKMSMPMSMPKPLPKGDLSKKTLDDIKSATNIEEAERLAKKKLAEHVAKASALSAPKIDNPVVTNKLNGEKDNKDNKNKK